MYVKGKNVSQCEKVCAARQVMMCPTEQRVTYPDGHGENMIMLDWKGVLDRQRGERSIFLCFKRFLGLCFAIAGDAVYGNAVCTNYQVS